jgi:hypothetical protein
MGKKVTKRKERSDKKVDVKPTVPIHLYNCVADLADLSGKTIMDIVEFICMEGIKSTKVLEFISQYFRRDYQHNSTHYYGNSNLTHNRYISRRVPSRRISTRFSKEFNQRIEDLAFSLGMSISSSTGLLLDASIRDMDIIDRFIRLYTSNLNENQKDTLKNTLRYLYRNNPYREQITFTDIVKTLIDEVKEWTKNF